MTASSVFDFEGDGKAEMIYADEENFRIFDGTTGAVLFADDTHGSHTRIEMPVVVAGPALSPPHLHATVEI